MRRSVFAAVLLAGCFSDAPPVESDDGSDSSGTSEASSTTSDESADDSVLTDDGSQDGSGGDVTTGNDTADAVCGDGVPEGSEACDDANEEEHDGCTAECELAARILTMYEVASPTTLIGEDPDGSVDYEDSCYDPVEGEPRLLRGLYGRTGGTKADQWPVSSGGTCNILELDWRGDTAVLAVLDADAMLMEYGDHMGLLDNWQTTCDIGTVPVGISAQLRDGDAGPYIVAIRLECATLVVDATVPDHVGFASTEAAPWAPLDHGGRFDTVLCDEGAVLVGYRAFADHGLAAWFRVGVECAVPVVEFGPA